MDDADVAIVPDELRATIEDAMQNPSHALRDNCRDKNCPLGCYDSDQDCSDSDTSANWSDNDNPKRPAPKPRPVKTRGKAK